MLPINKYLRDVSLDPHTPFRNPRTKTRFNKFDNPNITSSGVSGKSAKYCTAPSSLDLDNSSLPNNPNALSSSTPGQLSLPRRVEIIDTASSSNQDLGLTLRGASIYTMDGAKGTINRKIPNLPKQRTDPNLAARVQHQSGALNSVQVPNSRSQAQPPSLSFLSLADIMDLPPKKFPTLMAAPDLPLRMSDQSAALRDLDSVFNRKMYSLDGKRMVDPLGEDSNFDTSDKGRKFKEIIKETKVFERLEARMPYVQLASLRLQAICGVRNDTEFTLPPALPSLSPALAYSRTFRGQGLTSNIRRVVSDTTPQKVSPLKRAHSENDLAIQYKNGGRGGIASGSNQSLDAMGSIIDKQTGRGLREYLLQMGKAHGMRKRHCDSLSMFDFTPEVKFDSPQNQKLQHFSEKDGYRIDVYEVDLPTTQTNHYSGGAETSTESWVWFFISHSLIDTPDPSKPSTHPPTKNPAFPHPPPNSSVVFALPLSHCNQYKTATEFKAQDNASQQAGQPIRNILHKRIDYDLSFQGLPIFEFSHKPENTLRGWYSWCQQNNILTKKSRLNPKTNYYFEGEHGRFLNIAGEISDYQEGDDGWWGTWYWKLFHELLAWEKVKLAMGRGRCRVVIRWRETEVNEEMDSLLKLMYDDIAKYGGSQKDELGGGGGVGLGIDIKGLKDARGRQLVDRGGPAGLAQSMRAGAGPGSLQNGPPKNGPRSLKKEIVHSPHPRKAIGATRMQPPARNLFGTSNNPMGHGKATKIANLGAAHPYFTMANPEYLDITYNNPSFPLGNNALISAGGMGHGRQNIAPTNVIATQSSPQTIPKILPTPPAASVPQLPIAPTTTTMPPQSPPPAPKPTPKPAPKPKKANGRKGKGQQKKRK